MKKLLRTITAAAVATLASGILVAGWAGSASASGNPPWEPDGNSVGGLYFYNAAGQQITGGSIDSSPIAAYVEGAATIRSGDTKATLFGYLPVDGEAPGQWSGESLSASTTYPDASAPSSLATATLPLVAGASGDETIAELAADFPNTDTSDDGYASMYVLRLKTSGVGLSPTSEYDSADISITGSTWSVVYPTISLTSTSTELQATPSTPQQLHSSVGLRATITPPAPGTVQFEVGSTDIGSPVTVSGGTASISTSALPVGDDAVSAVFTPAQFSTYSGSTGSTSVQIFTVPGAPTALRAAPSTGSIDVSWAAPSTDGGSTITGYTAKATSGPTVKTCTATGTSCVISGLNEAQAYTVTAAATNAAGSGSSGSVGFVVYPVEASSLTVEVPSIVVKTGVAFPTLAYGKPSGTSVSLDTDGVKSTCTTDASGQCIGSAKVTKTGDLTIDATAGKTKASAKFYAPDISVAKSATVDKTFTVAVATAPPHSVVSISLSDSRAFSFTTNSSGKGSVKIKALVVGTLTVTVSIDGTTFPAASVKVSK